MAPRRTSAWCSALNLPWLLMPFAMIWRMRRDRPFSRPAPRSPVAPRRAGPGGGGVTSPTGTGRGPWWPARPRASAPRSPPSWPAAASTWSWSPGGPSRWPRWPRPLPAQTVAVAADLATEDGLAAVSEAAGGREVGLVVVQRRLRADRAVPRPRPGRARSVPSTSTAGAGARWPTGTCRRWCARGRGGLHRHVVAGRAAGLAADHRVRGDQGVRRGARRGAVGRAARAPASTWSPAWPVRSATPGYRRVDGQAGARHEVARDVVAQALHALPHGPRVVPGALMKFSAALMSRLLPRRTAIGIIGRTSSGLAAAPPAGP